MKYDVGLGLYGAVFAHEVKAKGYARRDKATGKKAPMNAAEE